MVDVHAHILPCDHGCDSPQMALEQLRLAQHYGITAIIATPHFDCRTEDVESFLERRDKALANVQEINNTAVSIIAAAEVSLERGLETVQNLEKLCIGNTNHILIELSKEEHGDWAYEALYAIERRGLFPIIAHIHRYDPFTVERLFQMDYYFQINADCMHPPKTWRQVKKWIENRQVHFIGSDIHGSNAGAYQQFHKLYRSISKEEKTRFSQNAITLIE